MYLKKCIVWDLDNTLWDGVRLEGKVFIKNDVIEVIKELDKRGILHSIASRGDENLALKTLEEFQIKDYFLVPKINWLQKSNNIISISKELNISLDSIAFIDDDEFELEQVSFMLPGVLTLKANDACKLPLLPEFSPESVTNESKNRRQFYQAEQLRKKSGLNFIHRQDFLKSCSMKLTVRQMEKNDISRVVELMTRTHQLNTTGWILDHNELLRILGDQNNNRKIYVAELDDKFGSYGIIGTAITEKDKNDLILKYLAISCRVMGRGIERTIIIKLLFEALENNISNFYAEFHNTGKNRTMRALYQMLNFQPSEIIQHNNGTMLFSKELKEIPLIPSWLEIV